MPVSGGGPLSGKTALVTGASRNIGREICLRLAREGAHVCVNTRQAAEAARAVVAEVEAAGGSASLHMADVTDEAAVVAMAEAAGPVDILVNNAAIRRHVPFLDSTLADWREAQAVVLEGAYLCARAVLASMQAKGWGRIINMGGVSAHMGMAERAHVSAAKAGLIGFTKGLAKEFGLAGITVNCVVPGVIDTVRDPGGLSPGQASAVPIAVGRQGRPEEVAETVVHLCRPESAYITGATIHVNGGAYLP